MVKCITIYEKEKYVPKEKLIFRASAYGIIIKDEKILLITIGKTGKYFLPGGGVEKGEILEEAVKREVKEETGYNVKVKKFLDFKETFFYYNPSDNAYHSFLFFYVCEIISGKLHENNEAVLDENAENPNWIGIETLKKEDFQMGLEDILEIIKKLNCK